MQIATRISDNRQRIIITGAVVILISIFAGIWYIHTHWGVQGRYYPNKNWEGRPQLVRRDHTVFLQDQDVAKLLSTDIFSVKWKGWIVITEPGEYTFATASDDGSFLSIDGQRVVDNGGDHGLKRASGTIFLETGNYQFEVLYFTIGGVSEIETFWTPPHTSEEPLPDEVLFLKSPSMFDFRLRKGILWLFRIFRLPGLILGISLIILLPVMLIIKVLHPFLRTLSALTKIAFLKKAVFYGLILLLLIVTMELCAWAVFTIFQERFTFFDVQNYLVTPEQQERMSNAYMGREENLAFGWDLNFSTPHGERPRLTSYGIPLIATFGDSFTYCAEVKDHQTWQTHLADLLKMDVYNFGVGGYGTDQAYLKFLAKYPEIRTPVVFLGLTTENINRIVNVYRPFYFPRNVGRSTKPRFVLKDNELVLLPNPLRSRSDIPKLGDIQFIHKIGEHDWWYNRDNHPVLGFPYLKILFNKRLWLEIYYGKGNREINDIDPRPWEDLWYSEEARNLMFRILDTFIAKAEASQAIPVIVVLPLQYQVERKYIRKDHDRRLSTLVTYCESKGYRHFETITPLVERVTAYKEIRDLYAGHVSPKGNQIIAEALFDYLQKEMPDVIKHYQPRQTAQPTESE